MQDYRASYQKKLCSAAEAVKQVRSGDWLDYAIGVSTPNLLDKALGDRAEELEDINIRGMLVFRPLEIFAANDRVGRRVFTFNSWHVGGVERAAMKKGYCFFTPIRYCDVPEYYRRKEDLERVDVLMVQTAPMDSFGYFNFGPTNSHIMEAARRADRILIEVNPNMPRVGGLYDEHLHIDQVTAVVENQLGLDELPNAVPDEIDRLIATKIVACIPDGATLQLGIGGMPNAVGEMIARSDLKDLGIHTEMYVDSMVDMTEAGVITGKYKNFDREKQVFSFAAGPKRMYDFLNENPALLTAPVDYVNDPKRIAELDRFISINSAIEMDIYGQVNSETVGYRHISGTGGQLDFVIGAYHSRGGMSFIALSSTFTDKSGARHSRILPSLSQGTVVTDPRSTPQYIVTEYGMVNLKGKSTWQRAEALISVAHPDYHEELIRAAEKQGIWRGSNKR